MSVSRVNSGFELIASLRQSNLAAIKRSLDVTVDNNNSSAIVEAKVDDRRKLAIISGKRDGAATVRKYFTPSEIQELAGILQETATSNAELGVALAMAAQEFVPADHRGFGFWDYFSINLYKCERNGDAYLIWNRAVTATPPESSKDAKTTKVVDKKQIQPTTQDNKGPSGNNDAPVEKTAEPKKDKELPLRPRVRPGKRSEPIVEKEKEKEKEAEEVEVDTDAVLGKVVETFVKCDSSNLSHIRNNMGFALQRLKCTPLKTELPTLEKLMGRKCFKTTWTSVSIPLRFHAFNPSIIQHPVDKSKFLVNLRAGNYFMNANHRYEFPAGMTGITTLNFLGDIDQNFQGSELGTTKQIKAPPMPNPYPDIGGLEDIRLIFEPESKKLYASFTSLEVTPEHRPQVCLMQVDPKKGKIIGAPVRLHGFDSDKTQKNWIGFADAGKLYFIYSLQPITIVQANPKSGEVKVVSVDATPVLNEWRGSSPLVELSPDLVAQLPSVGVVEESADVRWFIALVHISHFPRYHHQFIVMKKTNCLSEFRPFSMQITHQSPPFVFEKHDVEFSCGMAFTSDHSEIVIPYSKRDNDCTCMRIPTESLLKQNMHLIPDINNFKLRSTH